MEQRAPFLVLNARYASRHAFTGAFSEIGIAREMALRTYIGAIEQARNLVAASSWGTSEAGFMPSATTTPMTAWGNKFQNESSAMNCFIVRILSVGAFLLKP